MSNSGPGFPSGGFAVLISRYGVDLIDGRERDEPGITSGSTPEPAEDERGNRQIITPGDPGE